MTTDLVGFINLLIMLSRFGVQCYGNVGLEFDSLTAKPFLGPGYYCYVVCLVGAFSRALFHWVGNGITNFYDCPRPCTHPNPCPRPHLHHAPQPHFHHNRQLYHYPTPPGNPYTKEVERRLERLLWKLRQASDQRDGDP